MSVAKDRPRTSHPRVRKAFKRFTIGFLGFFFLFMPTAFLMYISLLVGLYHKDMRAWLKRRFQKKPKYVIRSVEGNKMVIVRKDVAKKAKKEGTDSVSEEEVGPKYYLSCGHPIESHGPRPEDCPDYWKK